MKKILLLGTLTLLVGQHFAQKKNITDAALLMKKYNPMKFESAKKNVNEAKNFIDQAAVNPETKDDFKMHLYRGEVYYALTEIASMDKRENGIDEKTIESYIEIAKESFKKVTEDPKKRWVSDMESFFSQRLNFTLTLGDKSFEKKDFYNAALMYGGGYFINSIMNKEDTTLSKYTAYCFQMDVDQKLAAKDFDSAMILADQVYALLPKDIRVLTTIINIYLQKGDITLSEKYLNEALAIDPKNSQLYYVLGTAYMDLNEYTKAEEALLKAIQYNPENSESLYQLGAHYFNWAKQLKMEASQLDYKDPKVAEYDEKIRKLNLNSLKYLEPWIEKNPGECSVYQVISQLYYQLDNEEKDNEFNTKYRECKKQSKN